MKYAFGFSGILLAVSCACVVQMLLAVSVAAQEDYKCDTSQVATTGDVGHNLVFRDKIMIRGIKTNAGWTTACPVPLNLPEPKIGGSACRPHSVLKGKSLKIASVDGKLRMSILDANGKELRSDIAQQWNHDGTTATDGGDWLELTYKQGEVEEHYFAMLLDYNGAAIPGLAAIAKLYLVEVFDVPSGTDPLCALEMPGPGNVKLVDLDKQKAVKAAAKAKVGEAKDSRPMSTRQADAGAGPEPGNIRG